MADDWAFQIGKRDNFVNCSSNSYWLIVDKSRTFLANVKEGDKLWFVRNKEPGDTNNGKICAVAIFVSKNEVDFNRPLLAQDAGRGLANEGPVCNIQIHYTNLYNLETLTLYTGLGRHSGVINCKNITKGSLINYPKEYETIVKYSQITKSM
jgi:hypothetical protein